MRLLRDLRLIPVVALAAAALVLLKATSIVAEGGYTLTASRAALAQGLGAGLKADEMPPPAPLDDALPRAAGGERAGAPRLGVSGGNDWVRDIYQAPTAAAARTDAPEYT